MTIEQLVGKSADELESMSKTEIEAWCAPYIQFVRPSVEQAEKPKERMANFGKDKEARLQRLMDMIPD